MTCATCDRIEHAEPGEDYLAHREIVSAVSEGPRGRVFLNADYDHEVVHADHIAGNESANAVVVIAYGRVVTYPMHAVRFIDWGTV